MTRDELKVWLDRPSPDRSPAKVKWWTKWYEGEEYLGEGSARTGPDPVQTDQKCDCNQCKGV